MKPMRVPQKQCTGFVAIVLALVHSGVRTSFGRSGNRQNSPCDMSTIY
jgi:hypothetical protein